MDYLRSRSLLLSQPYWNPYTYSPGQDFAEANIKKEKSNETEVKGEGHATADAGSLLNLSSLPITDGNVIAKYLVSTEGLVRHQCPYCSHTTNYPEVLWIHQRVAHRVDGNSSLAPKWAPCMNSLKSSKAGASQWRRTGPPPFLEGKDCPALPAPRTQRTQPPGLTQMVFTGDHMDPKLHRNLSRQHGTIITLGSHVQMHRMCSPLIEISTTKFMFKTRKKCAF